MADIGLNLVNTSVSHVYTPGVSQQSASDTETRQIPSTAKDITNEVSTPTGNDKAMNEKESQKERERIEKDANAIFDALNTGLGLRFYERGQEWYAVVENKITHEVIKEIPPKSVLELHAKLREMIGFFLDKKI